MAMSHSKACAVAVSSNTVLLNLELANSVTISSKVLSKGLICFAVVFLPPTFCIDGPAVGRVLYSQSVIDYINHGTGNGNVHSSFESQTSHSSKPDGILDHSLCCKVADAVAKRYRPWPKGLRADSLPWFDSPLVQGASRLRYTDKAQVAATGPYWPKGARNKKILCAAKCSIGPQFW